MFGGMFGGQTGVGIDRDALRRELLFLRDRKGISARKLLDSSNLLQALGTADPNDAEERLLAEIRSLGRGIEVQALINAYGFNVPLSDRLTPLSKRRHNFARIQKFGDETVLAYEDWV